MLHYDNLMMVDNYSCSFLFTSILAGETFNASIVFTDIGDRGYAQFFDVPPDGEVRMYGSYETLEIMGATARLHNDVSIVLRHSIVYIFATSLFVILLPFLSLVLLLSSSSHLNKAMNSCDQLSTKSTLSKYFVYYM